MRQFNDLRCLITGASSGIGAEFARQLAKRGANLILVARRRDRLEQLASELQHQHETHSQIINLDLTTSDAVPNLCSQVADRVDLLVNNAGFGYYGEFHDMERDRAVKLMQLNMQVLVELTHAFLPDMLDQKSGTIINVASTSAFQAVPYMSLYAATKAFVLHFSEGLWAETRKKGVKVQALCPGFTKTEFFDEASLPHSVAFGTKSVEDIVSHSLKQLSKGRQYTIPGWTNFLVAMSNRLVPRKTAATQAAKSMHPRKHRQ